ncbi:MAG: 50S ribosomal protein L21 [Vampirovibrionales bacterium]
MPKKAASAPADSNQYAIVELNGKQYTMTPGRYTTVDLLAQDADATLTVDKVLMVVDGDNTRVGAPYVSGASVTLKVLNHYRDKKVLVYKMRCKKGYRRKNGHRQSYTRVQVEALNN